MARSVWRVGRPFQPRSSEAKRPAPVRSHDVIPRVIHQVFGLWDGDAPLTGFFARASSTWRARHPGFRYVLWRAPMVEALVEQAPEPVRRAYSAFKYDIQRADLARYLILQAHGGVYADLDVVCSSNIGPLLAVPDGARAVLFVERVQSVEAARHWASVHPIRRGAPEVTTRMANYVMAAAPRAPVMDRVIALLLERANLTVKGTYDVLYTTGPDVVSEAVHASRGAGCAVVPAHVARLYFRHRCAGSWRAAVRSSAPSNDEIAPLANAAFDPRTEPID